MAEIEIAPLSERLSDDELAELAGHLEKLGVARLPKEDDSASLGAGDHVEDSVLDEFFDRLEAHDAAAEIYLPIEFEGTVEVSEMRVASLSALADALEEMKDELGIEAEDEEEDDEEEEDDDRLIDEQLREVWRMFHGNVQSAIERKLALHVKS